MAPFSTRTAGAPVRGQREHGGQPPLPATWCSTGRRSCSCGWRRTGPATRRSS
jgi:hypothetical protein